MAVDGRSNDGKDARDSACSNEGQHRLPVPEPVSSDGQQPDGISRHGRKF